MRPCPFCAEEVQEGAIFCKYCSKFLPTAPPPRLESTASSRKMSPPGAAAKVSSSRNILGVFVILGVLGAAIGIGLVLGPTPRESEERRAEAELAREKRSREGAQAEAASKEQERQQASASAISAGALLVHFETNEVRANQTYKGKEIHVSGVVDTIGTDILDTPYIRFESGSIFGVQAMFRKRDEGALAQLDKGQAVIVRCRCEGKLGNVLLRDCRIVKIWT